MITILHGDDLVSSRKALEVIKSSYERQEIVVLDGQKTDLPSLKLALETPALFSCSRLVILEIFLGAKPEKEILEYLSSGNFFSDLVIWERKEISQRLLAKLSPPAKTRLFKTPPIVFKFLDSLHQTSAGNSLSLLHKTLEKSPTLLVFYLLARHLRELILVKSGQGRQFPFWKSRKLTAQAKFFSEECLRRLYRKLLLIDWQQKTGRERFDLIGELEMMVLAIDENLGIS